MSVGIPQAGSSSLFKGLRKEVQDLELRGRKRQRSNGQEDSGFADDSYMSSRFDSTRIDSTRRVQNDDDGGYSSLQFSEERRSVGETTATAPQSLTTQLSDIDEGDRAAVVDREEGLAQKHAYVPSAISSSVREFLKPSPGKVDDTQPVERREFYTENTHYHNYACSGDTLYLLAPFRQVLSVPNDDGDTALHLSVINFRQHVVRQILTVRPNDAAFTDQTNTLGQTALHLAVLTNQPQVVGNLLAAGADPTKVDRNGNTPLHLAARCGFCPSASLVVEACRRRQLGRKQLLDQRNFDGFTALHLATRGGHVDVMTFLVFQGADVDSQDFGSGRSALHHAVENNQLAVTSALLFRLGANVDAVTSDGSTPLHLAAGIGLCDMVAVLIAAGADSKVKNAEDDLPIDMTRNEKILSLLHSV